MEKCDGADPVLRDERGRLILGDPDGQCPRCGSNDALFEEGELYVLYAATCRCIANRIYRPSRRLAESRAAE